MNRALLYRIFVFFAFSTWLLALGCGPESEEVRIPMLILDDKITEVTSHSVRVTFRTNLEATVQIEHIHIPAEVVFPGMDFQELLQADGVDFSNSDLHPTPTCAHDYTVNNLVPGDWYALVINASNQRGASAQVIGWKYTFRTFGQLPAIIGPP